MLKNPLAYWKKNCNFLLSVSVSVGWMFQTSRLTLASTLPRLREKNKRSRSCWLLLEGFDLGCVLGNILFLYYFRLKITPTRQNNSSCPSDVWPFFIFFFFWLLFIILTHTHTHTPCLFLLLTLLLWLAVRYYSTTRCAAVIAHAEEKRHHRREWKP